MAFDDTRPKEHILKMCEVGAQYFDQVEARQCKQFLEGRDGSPYYLEPHRYYGLWFAQVSYYTVEKEENCPKDAERLVFDDLLYGDNYGRANNCMIYLAKLNKKAYEVKCSERTIFKDICEVVLDKTFIPSRF